LAICAYVILYQMATTPESEPAEALQPQSFKPPVPSVKPTAQHHQD
jgi:hypothetical protein